MKPSEQKPICLAPWRAISIRPNGNVLPDGQYEVPYGNINSQSLPEILNSTEAKNLRQSVFDMSFPKGCQSCQKKEKSIGHSRRLFFEHKIRKFTPSTILEPSDPCDIHYLDLNLSNKCNLKCRMCSSHSSSAWVSEEKKLLVKGGNNFRLNKKPMLHEVQYDQALKNFDHPEHFQNLKGIALQGGEPLLQEKNLEVLQKFVDWGLASQITIDLSSNGTVISPQIKKLIEQFKQVDFYISIEGAGELYKYIRGDKQFSIESLEKNLIEFRKISNLSLSFAITTSIYNILYLDDLLNWFEQVHSPTDDIIMSNTVVRPEYLSFQILPRKLKEVALKRLEKNHVLEKLYKSGPRKIGDPGKGLILESLKKEIYTPDEKLKLIDQFLSFNCSIDSLRGTQLLEIAPELEILFNKDKLKDALGLEPSHEENLGYKPRP